jgi:hypothetical protein
MFKHPSPPSSSTLTPFGWLRMCLGLGLLSLMPGSLQAQAVTEPPSELDGLKTLRDSFYQQIKVQSQKLNEQYERALARIESELAEAGDYDQAIQVKKRRDQLQQLQDATALATSLALPLTPDSVKSVGVSADTDGVLSGWRLASHYAEWTMPKLAPGDYFLELDSVMTALPPLATDTSLGIKPKVEEPEETALFEVFEVSLLAGAADNRRSFELKLSKSGNAEFNPQRIGPMRFARSPITLRLSAARSYPANFIRIANLRLIPAAAIPAAPTTLPTVTTDTAAIPEIRKALSAALQEAYAPLDAGYIDELKALAVQYPDWKSQLDTERLALEKRSSARPKQVESGSLLLPKPMATLGGISGFQDLENVTYIEHPDNAGDRFRVSHDGQEFTIRLLWLHCERATPQAAAQPRTSPFSQHFSLSPEDAALFGRAALQFTTGYLTGKTFRLLARNNPDPDGTFPALIFLPDIGLFHNLLIDQGLAAVTDKSSGGSTLERALHRSIEDREQEACNRTPRPGAWALSPAPSTQPRKP